MAHRTITSEELAVLASGFHVQIKKREVYAKPLTKTRSAGLKGGEWVRTNPRTKTQKAKFKLRATGRIKWRSLNYVHQGTLTNGLSTKQARATVRTVQQS